MEKIFILLITLLAGFQITASAQSTKLGGEVLTLSNYVASTYFDSLQLKANDISRVDSLYKEALKTTGNNHSEALFALIFCTVPYKKVPIRVPLTKLIIQYPLVSAGDSVFNMKNKNLPKYLYFDSPRDSFGDKDKLAHFFGSAFLAYSSNVFDLTDLIGYFVEVFEQDFVPQSTIDTRDLQSDELGTIFGLILKQNKNVLPSQVMLINSLFYFRYHL